MREGVAQPHCSCTRCTRALSQNTTTSRLVSRNLILCHQQHAAVIECFSLLLDLGCPANLFGTPYATCEMQSSLSQPSAFHRP